MLRGCRELDLASACFRFTALPVAAEYPRELPRPRCAWKLSSHLVQELDVRFHGTIDSLNFWIRRLDQEIFVRCVSAVAVSETESTRRKIEWRASEA